MSDDLTPRQIRVAQAYADGHKRLAIAMDIGCSPSQVRNDLLIIKNKVGARNSTHAVVMLVRRGVID